MSKTNTGLTWKISNEQWENDRKPVRKKKTKTGEGCD